MKRKLKNNRGFTLIELLAAIVVLAIIVVMAMPQISNLIDSNNKVKYDVYAETIATSAKLYTDAYNEDMFGRNDSGCYDIKFEQMSEKKLLEDIKMNDVTCEGGAEKQTFARVYKSGEHYKYTVSILCTNKNNETTILYSDLIEEELERPCDGTAADEDGPTIEVSPPPTGWVKDSGAKATITVYDPYGLFENATIKYAWTKTPNSVADSAFTTKNFGNVRFEEEVTTAVPYPSGITDEYYLVVKPETLMDSNGNYYSGDPIKSGPYKIDNTPPRITSTTNSSNGQWTNSNVTITINTSDAISGVTKIYYSTNSSTPTAIKSENKTVTVAGSVGTKTFTNEMEKTVYVMAEDAAGNLSDVVSAGAVKIDKTGPTCTITPTGTKGTNNWYKSNVTLTLEADSTASSYNLTTSTTPSYNGTTKTQTQTNTTGTTWYGYVKDAAGNVGTCTSGIIKVDTAAPTCTVNASGTLGENDWYKSNATITISTNDTGGSTVDSHDLTTSTTATYKGTSSATQSDTSGTTWYGYVKDKAGNVGKCNKVVKVSTKTPGCTINISGTKGENGWYKSNVTLTLSANDTAGGYNLTTSTTPSYNGTSKTQTQSSTTGTTWYGYVKDSAGNVGTCSSGVIKIDTAAPTCSVTASGTTGENGWYKSNATVKISTNDTGGSNVNSYNLTTSTTASYGGTSTGTQTNTAGTKWYGYVKDNAGNVGSCNSTIKVDTTAPTCSIGLSGTKKDTYYASAVTVSLTKNDSGGSSLGSYGLTTSSTATYNSKASASQSSTSGITWYGYVKDNAGNTGKCNSGSFVVKLRSVPEFTYTGSYQIVDDKDNVISDPNSYTGNWKIRFLSSGTFTITNLNGAANGIDVFLVGGGGNGGSTYSNQAGRNGYAAGGGGGGGGYRTTKKGVSVSTTSYSITVGAARNKSTAFGYTANPGSNGSGGYGNLASCEGGPSGGSGGATGGAGIVNLCAPSNRNGSAGGCEFDDCNFSSRRYGGGGGGGHGHNGEISYTRGNKAAGVGTPGSGGAGGGGTGNNQYRGYNTHNGEANTGGGGGGASFVFDKYDAGNNCWSSDGCFNISTTKQYSAGTGGTGIVIIRNKR